MHSVDLMSISFCTNCHQPAKSNNTLIYAALAAGVAGAGGYYFYGTSATPAERIEEIKTVGREAEQVAEAKTGLGLKKKEDYQKVYNRIAEMLEVDDYDGERWNSILLSPSPTLPILTCPD